MERLPDTAAESLLFHLKDAAADTKCCLVPKSIMYANPPHWSIATLFNAFEIIVKKASLLLKTCKIKSMAQSITIRLWALMSNVNLNTIKWILA